MSTSRGHNDAGRFFAGLLISSVGGMTFTIGLIVFMMRAGFDLFQVSIILGLSRLIPILVSTLLGDIADRTSAKRMVLFTELVAGFSSVGILWSWSRPGHAYLGLATMTVIRSVVLAIQSGSRNKLVKELSGDGYESNAKNAVYYNKATQGATLFAGLLAWLAFEYVNFEWVILFDGATFFLNGLLLLSLFPGALRMLQPPCRDPLRFQRNSRTLSLQSPRGRLGCSFSFLDDGPGLVQHAACWK